MLAFYVRCGPAISPGCEWGGEGRKSRGGRAARGREAGRRGRQRQEEGGTGRHREVQGVQS